MSDTGPLPIPPASFGLRIMELLQTHTTMSSDGSVPKTVRRPRVPEPILEEIATLIQLCQENESRVADTPFTVALVSNALSLAITLLTKQLDYGNSLEKAEILGPSLTVVEKAHTAMDEKIRRIQSLRQTGVAATVQNEPLADAYRDLSGWSMIAKTGVELEFP